MPHRALIDSSALLALANPRDQYHAPAVTIGRRFLSGGGRWVGSALVLGELHAHLLRWRGLGDASSSASDIGPWRPPRSGVTESTVLK
jgi:predicted nucleic acid-binding protein